MKNCSYYKKGWSISWYNIKNELDDSYNKKFNEAQTKFFIACVILSLEYLHKNKIIHHDNEY